MTVTELPLEGVTVSVAERLPPAAGVNVTATVQFELPASIPPVRGQVVPVPRIENSLMSVPPMLIPVIEVLEVELFVTVTEMDALVIVICVPGNEQVKGEPEQPADDELTVRRGVTVSIPIANVVPVVAVTVTAVGLVTGPPAVTINGWEVEPGATVTEPEPELDGGRGTRDGSPSLRLTTSPLDGALLLRVTVPVETCPDATLPGLKDSIETTGGITVTPPPAEAPLGSVAVTVTAVLLATGEA